MYLFQLIQKKILHQRTAKCLIDIQEEVMSYVSTAQPSIESYDNELEYQHAVFLQKIIKGRAIQSILHEGKEAHQDLINQLKETFKLESVWKAECADDWNEESVMEFLGKYIDQEFVRYAEQQEIYDRRKLTEEEQRGQEMERNRIQNEKEQKTWDGAMVDFYENISELEMSQLVDVSNLDEQSSENIVPNILSNLVQHAVQIGGKEEIVRDAIENIIQKVTSHPAEDVMNNIIDDIVKKTVELSSSTGELNADSLDLEIGAMLDELCDQLLTSINEIDETDSDIDNLDE